MNYSPAKKSNYKSNPSLRTRKDKPFVDVAVDHMLSSPVTTNKIYREELEKMSKDLMESDILWMCIVVFSNFCFKIIV